MSTDIQKKEPPKAVSVIQSTDFMQKVQNILPKVIKPEHFVRVALHALSTTPKLLQCTPASVCNCMMDLARTGLEPDGRNAHLLPYRDNKNNTMKCQLIVDWKGMVELARRSGQCAMWKADIIFENDDFLIDKGEVKSHTIDWRNSDKRGNPLLVYSYFRYKDGTEDYEIMTMDECEAIRKRSRAGNNGPWVTDRNEMLKKTVMRRHSKRLPQSPEMMAALGLDFDTPDFDLEAAIPEQRKDVIQPIDVEPIDEPEPVEPAEVDTAEPPEPVDDYEPDEADEPESDIEPPEEPEPEPPKKRGRPPKKKSEGFKLEGESD